MAKKIDDTSEYKVVGLNSTANKESNIVLSPILDERFEELFTYAKKETEVNDVI